MTAAVRAPIEPSIGRSPPIDREPQIHELRDVHRGHHRLDVHGQPVAVTQEDLQVTEAEPVGHRHLVRGGDAVRGRQGRRAELELLDLVVSREAAGPPAEPLHRFLRDASGRGALRSSRSTPSSSDRIPPPPSRRSWRATDVPSARWITKGRAVAASSAARAGASGRLQRDLVVALQDDGVLLPGRARSGERQQRLGDRRPSRRRGWTAPARSA